MDTVRRMNLGLNGIRRDTKLPGYKVHNIVVSLIEKELVQRLEI